METPEYYKSTPPLEFLRDIRDIMVDGDGLPPEALIIDIRAMLEIYLDEHKETKSPV